VKTINEWRLTPTVMKQTITNYIAKNIEEEKNLINFPSLKKTVKFTSIESIDKIYDYLNNVVQYSHFLTSLTFKQEEN